MNHANWSIQSEIVKRVQLEDRHNWALKEEKIELPKYVKPKKVEYNAGVWNFVKGILKELQP